MNETDIDGLDDSGIIVSDTTPLYDIDINAPQLNITTGDDDTVTITNFEPELQIEVIPRSGYMNFSQGTPKMVMVGNTSTMVLMPNIKRRAVLITNNTLITVFLRKQDDAIYGQGLKLPANSSYEIDLTNLYLGKINAICIGDVPVALYVEEGVK